MARRSARAQPSTALVATVREETSAGDVDSRDASLASVLKGIAYDGDAQISNLRAREEEMFTEMGALPSPYPAEMLVRFYERSSALRPCIEALVTNIHGFGHRLVPRIDLDSPEADEKIAQVILSERLQDGDDDPDDPTPAEVAARREEIARGMAREKLRLSVFFHNCCPDGFIELRKQVWTDYEITGNAYIEVRRDAAGRIARLNYAPATNMRLLKLEREPVWVTHRERISEISYREIQEPRRMRGFVQIVNGYSTYFKEFGDPRVMNSLDGRFYEDVDQLPDRATPATEILHFKVFSSRTNYGIARWIGAAFEVLGIRAASEVNYLYFDNKGVPPLAILVSGGTLNEGSATQIKTFIETRIKSRSNFHSVMILEALPAGGASAGPEAAGRVRIALQPLTDAQQKDGLFLQYSDQSEEIVGRQFRLPPIVRGKSSDYNRATSADAMRQVEQQVFQPERGGFDERFDRTILTDLAVRYLRMESNSPIASDPEVLAKIIVQLLDKGAMTPAEARPYVNDILNDDMPKIEATWGKQPLSLTLAGVPVEDPQDAGANRPAAVGPSLPSGNVTTVEEAAALPAKLTALRDQYRAQAEARFNDAVDDARKAEGGVEVITVPPEMMAKWVRPHNASGPAGGGRAERWPTVDSGSRDSDEED